MRRVRLCWRALGATLSLAFSLLAALLVTLLLGLWLWGQSEGSLQQALQIAGTWLPSGQSLQASGVTGSIQSGGHIARLQWQQGERRVEVQDLDLAWDWRGLFDGELRVTRLQARLLRGEDHSPSTQSPISELLLPLRADIAFALDRLEWAGSPALQIDGLRGHYRFDGKSHFLQDASLQMAAGSYSGQGQLQAIAPMALSLTVQGQVQTPPALQQLPLSLVAQASGTLRGPHALVELSLTLQPKGRDQPLASMQASLQASIHPGQAQPIASAQAQWSALDLASLWPQAPQTLLSGQAKVLPDAGGWSANIQLQNAMAGTLDKQRLPLRSAQAGLLYRDGQWQLQALQAALGGGSLQAKGNYSASPAQWSASASLLGIEPAQLDSRWKFPALRGKWQAQQTAQGIAFEGQLQAALKGSGAQDTSLLAKGQWQAPLLQIDRLELQTPQAQLSGSLLLDTQSRATTARLQAKLPGAQATLEGSAAASTGQGSSALHVSDAHALLQWLASLPGMTPALASIDLAGAAELTAQWQGGWQRGGEQLQVQARLQSQRLELQAGQSLQDLQLDLAGTLRELSAQLRGKAQLGATQWALQAQAHGAQPSDGQWQGRLERLQLSASSAQHSQPWSLQLQQPVALDWRSGALARSFAMAEGSLRLSGPGTGTAQIQWQPLQWAQQGAGGSTRWSSKGQLQGLPLVWLELLGQTQLANLGLRGDLLFGGQWDAASEGSGLRLRANLQRSSGDLHLLGAEQGSATLAAGLRDAHVNLEVDRDALRASLVWASESAGHAEADFSTRLQNLNGSIAWALDAPLQARLHASLPRVGVWSLVAPVGWRIQGTLEADATLSGTRSKPDWTGSLAARDMAVRSVVDGIDFSQGVMRLQVKGQHLDIAELTLQGAGGSAGGQLQLSGAADWLPAAPGSSRLRMALQAKAKSFRVTARADQRLVVSGDLSAQLVDAKLLLRGALVADQALIVLPEDTAPKLGADVVVKRPAANKAAVSAPPAASPLLAQTVVPDIRITLDPGSNFQLQGHGIQTRLAGLLTLKAQGLHATPRLSGELHTVNGSYRAYGQRLQIEEGRLQFGGAYDNPALDILALRPNLQQRVGVQVSGTAQLPVVRLYSEPDLPDADKLSWLVLGRASSSGGAETALLQQAALALLAGKGKTPITGLVNAFGLDEVSVGQTATTNQDGTSGSEATLKLGKRISRDFYVAFERSLAGTMGTFYVFYDLSRRLTLRAESGAQSAVDLIFTTRFD